MIRQFEVGGIPALYTPADGPVHAGLAFRVGTADEPLSRRGITHLVEHLALHSLGVTDYHYNGATGEEITYFHLQGGEADVVSFLNGVCASLRNLPLHRLAIEKGILQTEQNGRGVSPDDPIVARRYGARGFGLRGYTELGLPAITPDDVRTWTEFFFTRANAALWVAGPAIPAGLRLDLPAGIRRPPPATSSALETVPAYLVGPSGVLAWHAEVRRGIEAEVFAAVLQRTMFRSLRQESGISYVAQAEYTPRGNGTAVVVAAADALPEKQSAVLGGFVDVLASLRFAGADPAEVATVVQQMSEGLVHAGREGRLLPSQIADLLTGHPVRDVDELVASARSVTPAGVHGAGLEAYGSGV